MKEKRILTFFDCDGTLIHTTLPEVGKPLWEQHHGKPYPHKGWWGREESLDMNVFPNHPNPDVYADYKWMKKHPMYITFVLTSREPKLQTHLEKIFAKHEIEVERVMCKKGNYTKGERMDQTIKEFSEKFDIVEVILYDDRNKEHATVEPYRGIWKNKGIELTLIKIESDAKD